MEKERLLSQRSSRSSWTNDEDDGAPEPWPQYRESNVFLVKQNPWWRPNPLRWLVIRAKSITPWSKFPSTRARRRSLYYWIARLISWVFYVSLATIAICGIFFPSYASPPQRYTDLRRRGDQGFNVNQRGEKIFIAASLYDYHGELVSGFWGEAVQRLIHLLGPENVFLSVYENDPDDLAQVALDEFSKHLKCNAELNTDHLDLEALPHIVNADEKQRLKRMTFLTEVRNRALLPLNDVNSTAYGIHFDKILYLNDIVFDPVDAANLLFSTNVDEESGKTQYRAACAVDFIKPLKFYDTFATRDIEGYSMGVPIYPWFSQGGKAESRKEVLAESDAVRVKGCWGGMVAFEAKWFQPRPDPAPVTEHQTDPAQTKDSLANEESHRDTSASNAALIPTVEPNPISRIFNESSPLLFRGETDIYWESSECCLIHADLSALDPSSLPADGTGIYMNPYIRTAYSPSVYQWLSFVQRFERLLTPLQALIGRLSGLPRVNPRQFQHPGDEVVDLVWVRSDGSSNQRTALDDSASSPDHPHGHYENITRTAVPGGFCGSRRLMYIPENPKPGEARWADDVVPIGGKL